MPYPIALLWPTLVPAFGPQELEGLYRAADGAELVLFPAPPEPDMTAMLELQTGEVRMLFPVGAEEYAFGPALAVGEPVEGSLGIDRDPDGGVQRVVRTKTDGAEQEFTRVGLRFETASFGNEPVRLAGTLVLPVGTGPFPALVMLHGSEPEPRAGNVGMALFLASKGIAALIFDKRGVGESSGETWQASFDEYASDAQAGFDWLRTRTEVAGERIGYWGHSQGAWIAALAGARTKAAAFVVLECGGALGTVETTLWWSQRKLEAEARLTPEEIHACLAYRQRKFDVVAGRLTRAELEPFTAEARSARWFEHVTDQLPAGIFWEVNAGYDPRPALEGLGHCAVLALFAEHDDHTPTKASVQAARAAFERSRHPRARVEVIPGANHALFETKTGGRTEVELPSLQRFAPEYARRLLGWLAETTRG